MSKKEKKNGQRHVSAPYVHGLSERIKKSLKKHGIILSTKTTKLTMCSSGRRTKYQPQTSQKYTTERNVKIVPECTSEIRNRELATEYIDTTLTTEMDRRKVQQC